MGKVPVLRHGEVYVAETGAICCYLAEMFTTASLAPEPGSVRRGDYLRWMFFRGNCLEPALLDVMYPRREPIHSGRASWGDMQRVMRCIDDTLQRGPYLLGTEFSAVDIVIGSALRWVRNAGDAVALSEVVQAYINRLDERPAWQQVCVIEAE